MTHKDLYQVDQAVAEAIEANDAKLTMVYALEGFVDAGFAAGIALNAIVDRHPAQRVVTFNVDALMDYRDRRPSIYFEDSRWTGVDLPELAIDLLHDEHGQPFLVLYGQEPDFKWDAVATAIEELIDRFGVNRVIGMTAMPMAVPHTRPASLTAIGSLANLVPKAHRWKGTAQVPASFMTSLAYRLENNGLEGLTLAVHVPHYAAGNPYPPAAVELLDRVEDVGHLSFDKEVVRGRAARTLEKLSVEVGQSQELTQVIEQLEQTYDRFTSPHQEALLPSGEEVPSGEDLAREFEQFLAAQSGNDDEEGA